MDSDCESTFSYDDEDLQSDSFSLTQLNIVVNAQFDEPCTLVKLAEGGYHKVYRIQSSSGVSLQAVVRVASSAFPRDKLESEVATLEFLRTRTRIPVPRVYSWNSDSANPVGAEYMIMEKVHGVAASDVWDTLDIAKKNVTISQIARYLVQLFKHRFAVGGSLYMSSQTPSGFKVGPIVIPSFYRALDGELRVPPEEWLSFQHEQAQFRGPFTSVTGYLLCPVKAELNFLSLYRKRSMPGPPYDRVRGEAAVAKGEAVLRKAVELYPRFPGDMNVYSPMTSPEKPFSIYLDDFRLANIMIDEATGDVTGLIDFEGTRIAPTWACAMIPGWLLEEAHEESLPGKDSDDVRAELRQTFMQAIREADASGEWERAERAGRPYRHLLSTSKYFVVPWGYREKYVDALLEWCKAHPGVVYDGPVNPASTRTSA